MGSGRAVAWLVVVDAVTKWLAYLFLPHGREVRPDALFQLALFVNRGLGTWADAAVGEKVATARAIPNAFGTAALALALLGARRLKLRWGWAALLCAAVAIVAFQVGVAASPWFRDLAFLGRERVEGVSRLLLVFVTWRQVAPGPWRAAVALWLAGVLGNTLCLYMPPFGAIDFVYSRPIDVVLRLGIFNLADVYQVAWLALLVVLVVRALAVRLTRRRGAAV
jgi:lipoprotein signal peptidase